MSRVDVNKNPGEGDLFFFHGAFTHKKDAVAKKETVPGAFVRTVWFRSGPRYGVLSPRREENPHRYPVVRWIKPVEELTSRQRMRRSHHPSVRPRGPKKCALCGSTKNIVIDHRNGDQSDIRRGNHRWLCTSCNTKKGYRDIRAGRGVREEREPSKDRPKVGTLVKVAKTKVKSAPGKRQRPAVTLHKANGKKRAASKKAAKRKRNSSAGELAERAVRRATKAYLKSGRTAKKVSVKVNPRIAPKMLQAYGQAFQRMLRAPYNQDTPKSVLMESFLAQHKIPVTEQARVKIYLGKVAKKNPRRKKGTASLARAKKSFKLFHGRKPTKVSARRVSKARRLPGNDFVKLGDLNYLRVKNPALAGGMIEFGLKERPVLATDPKRKRLFIIGGNQKLDGIPSIAGAKRNPGGLADLGELEQLEYYTRKQFDNYVPANYYHDLGEENGKRPRLMYDRKNQQLHVVGGDYKIQAAGIRN